MKNRVSRIGLSFGLLVIIAPRVFPGFAQFPVGVDIAEFSAQFIRRRTATR